MKTPTWGIVIGILMIAFGGCSVVNDMQTVYMPQMVEMQQDMMEGFSQGIHDGDSTIFGDSTDIRLNRSEGNEAIENMQKTMSKMFYMSDFTKTWIVRFGYIGVLVSLVYVLGGVFLLNKKNYSIKLAYAALAISIAFGVTKGAVLSSEASTGFIALSTGFSQMFGIVFDIIFLVVIATSDRSAYYTAIETDDK